MSDLTFEQWMARVNRLVTGRYGVGTSDLEDQPYRDWFDDGLTPAEAASYVAEFVQDEYGVGF